MPEPSTSLWGTAIVRNYRRSDYCDRAVLLTRLTTEAHRLESGTGHRGAQYPIHGLSSDRIDCVCCAAKYRQQAGGSGTSRLESG